MPPEMDFVVEHNAKEMDRCVDINERHVKSFRETVTSVFRLKLPNSHASCYDAFAFPEEKK